MIWFLVACLVPAFVVSLIATGLMRRYAPQWGLVDQPAARKVHTTPTPLGGGVGIYIGFVLPIAVGNLLAWWLSRQAELPAWFPPEIAIHLPGVIERGGMLWMLIGAGTLLAAAGLLDDLHPVSWKPRMLLQVVVAMALVAGGVRATVFVDYPWIGMVLSVLWIVGLINSMNFLDNMDALSGGIGLIAASIFAIIMLTLPGGPRWFVAGGMLILAGSLGGFLIYNRSPARIFMGDSGSTFLGMMLASLTVLGTFYDEKSPGRHTILTPLLVLAVPLYDTCTVVWIRLREGRSPFQPDKSHFSHRLVEMGLTRPGAVRTVHLATIITGLAAMLLYFVDSWAGALIVVTQVLAILSIITVLEQVARRKGSGNDASDLKQPASDASDKTTSGESG